MKPNTTKTSIPLLFLVLSLFFSGCATITRGTKDTLVIETDPPGAKVTLSTGETGTTPTAFKLPRKHDLTVYIEKAGYEALTIQVKSQVSGAGGVGMAGNVLIGGVIGAGVDIGTGAMKDLKPNPIKVNLVAVKQAEPAKLPIAAVLPAH